jgi:hypothetical protein
MGIKEICCIRDRSLLGRLHRAFSPVVWRLSIRAELTNFARAGSVNRTPEPNDEAYEAV